MATESALSAWGRFTVSGDVDELASTFDPKGPQYAQLAEEAAALAEDPLGPPAYEFSLGEFTIERPRPQRVVIVGPVQLARPGEEDQAFVWRIHLRWSGSMWRLWTVEAAE